MKSLKYYIIGILLTIMIVTGSTFAFLSSSTNSANNSLNTTSNKLEVVMTGNDRFDGALNVTDAEGTTGALSTVIKLHYVEGTPRCYGNIYIDIENIFSGVTSSSLIASTRKGFKYRVVATHDGNVVYTNTGNFSECRQYSDNNKTLSTSYNDNKICNNNDKLYIAKNVLLYTDDIEFNIYLWLDGNLVGNEVLGQNFKGYLNAETEYFTSRVIK